MLEYAFLGAIILGVAAFVLGFFGPLVLMPGANQGPLIGFAIAPPGALAGAALGAYIGWRQGSRKRSQ